MNTEFFKYPHLERLGHPEVDGILKGICYVFPKLDGTNASMWYDSNLGRCRYGSRNRELSLDKDNQGFMAAMESEEGYEYRLLCLRNPTLRFFGEWLVKHSIAHYRANAYRKFYIFDVYDMAREVWLSYDEYLHFLSSSGVEFVPAIDIRNGDELTANVNNQLAKNRFLIDHPEMYGEGIVIKNYSFTNRYGRYTYAKVIYDTFVNNASNKVTEGAKQVEFCIAEDLVTKHLVDKEHAKLENMGLERRVLIPRLLETVFHCVVSEELYGYLKKLKDPVDFKRLRSAVTMKVKELKRELF